MKNVLVKKVVAAAATAAILISSNAAFAAPVGSANAMLEKAAPAQKVDVYYRRWGWGRGPWLGAAIVGGALAGAAIANAYRPYYYYDPSYEPAYVAAPGSYYYYDAPPPPPGYYNAPPPQPGPPGPAYPRRCWVEGGVNGQSGYWTPC